MARGSGQADVERHVVDAGGDRPAQGPTGIVVVQHVAVLPSPAAARILEVADPFLFLRIDANDWQAMSYVPMPQPRQVAKLFIPIGILNPREPLAVGPQGELQLTQQPGIVVSASLCPRRRKAFWILRSDRCVHFSPEIGSPAVASRSSSSKVVRSSGLFFQRRGVRRLSAGRGRTAADRAVAVRAGRGRWYGDPVP